MTTYDHQRLFDNAKHIIPGGVNSPVRAFNGVGGTPLFFSRAKGAYLYDVNNKPYIDYVGSWGPMILGHADPDVIRAVTSAAADGLSFGAPTIRETTMAQLMCRYIPSLEQVRMVNSGTEAVMSALRLARAYTNRSLVIKFAGCYHGHSDAMLVKAGSGALTLGVPTSPGVSADTARNTITLEYNDEAAAVACFARYGEDIAAVIIEPVAGNMGCVLPTDSFLPLMRALCDTNKSVLIFDEVMTGFRIARGGASEIYKAVPDMITLGKIIGGGMPVGAFGGKREIMQLLAPVGPVYQAGTLSGNPVAMAAGIATLQKVCQDGFHDDITYRCQRLVAGIREAAEAHNVPVVVNHCGGMFGLFFTDQPAVTNFTEVMQCDTERYAAFFHAMLAKGIYLAPSAFEAGFISITHDDSVIDETVQTIDQVFGQLREQMLLAAAADVQE